MNKISVIIPCYNVSSYLIEGLGSIVNQTYRDLEIICLNDASTDKTLEILHDFAKKDPRIKVYSNEQNKGLIYTLNKLIDLASCDVLVRMDPDDIAEKNRIEIIVSKLVREKVDLVSTDYSLIDENSNPIKKKGLNLLVTQLGIKYTAIFNSPFPHPQSVFRKSIFDKEKYDFQYKAAEDYKLWTMLLLSNDFKGIIISKKLYRYRINETGMSISNAELQAENHIKIAKNYIEKLLNISTDGYCFWSIAKKTYNYSDDHDLNHQLSLIYNLHNIFINKFRPNKDELIEINAYTFQYLIYLYKNISKMSAKGEIPKKIAIIAILNSVIRTLKLFNFKNFKWIIKNI